MRQMISGLVAAVAVMAASAVPAMACGGGLFQSSCSPCGQAYVSPCAQPEVYAAPVEYSGCGSCGGWAHERLPDPVQQYYYVNQGPTYTGSGDWAPVPTYQESAVSGWGAYRHRSYQYGYDGGRYADAMTHEYDGAGLEGPRFYGYRAHPRFHGYYHAPRSYRYGYAPRRAWHEDYAPRRAWREEYAPRHNLRYGPMHGPRHFGYREYPLRRYN
jgi:hypothetical protein